MVPGIQSLEREIVFVDVTAFAVAVERVVHPDLKGRPVVVAPVGSSRPVVTGLSPEAWHAGIRKGMMIAKAVRYCRGVIVLPPNEPLYARASSAIFRILRDFSPVLEPSGHGHAYLDITGTERLFGPPRDTAWRAQKEIRQRLRLDAALGVASNKMVSRIASKITRPAGLQDVPHGDELSFLSPLPVHLLPGVGARTQEQLEELNIRIIRDITLMHQEHLTLVFGRFGFVLHQRALGIDDTPVYPVRAAPAVAREQVLPEDSNDYELLKSVLFGLCEEAGEQLRAEKQRAGRMELSIRYSDCREDSGKARLAPSTQSTATLCSQAALLLERNLTRRTRVRSLQLRLSDLACGSVQLELFADRKLEQQAKLESALDALRRRYGASVLARGQVRLPLQEYARASGGW